MEYPNWLEPTSIIDSDMNYSGSLIVTEKTSLLGADRTTKYSKRLLIIELGIIYKSELLKDTFNIENHGYHFFLPGDDDTEITTDKYGELIKEGNFNNVNKYLSEVITEYQFILNVHNYNMARDILDYLENSYIDIDDLLFLFYKH